MPVIAELLNALAFTEQALGWATGGRCEGINQRADAAPQVPFVLQDISQLPISSGEFQGVEAFPSGHLSVTPEER